MVAYTKKPLASQVGGHPGVSTSEDGSLLIKPALARELSFYQSLTSDSVLAPLRPHVPKFYGTLRYEGKVEDGNVEIVHEPPKEGKDKCLHLERYQEGVRVFMTTIHSIVLENLSHMFSKPNILDIKLGTKLYDDEANEVKKARMIQTAKNTTSLETGVRLTGFQVSNMQRLALGGIFVLNSSFACRFMTPRRARPSTRPSHTANRSNHRICQMALPNSSRFVRNSRLRAYPENCCCQSLRRSENASPRSGTCLRNSRLEWLAVAF